MLNSSPEITALLTSWSDGDHSALDKLLPLIERELHQLARRQIRRIRPGNSLQTTEVINEAYLRLVNQKNVQWQNRAHFFGIAAQLIRRILLNHIRNQKRLKRGGAEKIAVSLSEATMAAPSKADELIALDEALNKLALFDERKSKVVEMRYFGGLNVEETAVALKISPITVMRDWTLAKAWLAREIRS